jgi:hypothetical protein
MNINRYSIIFIFIMHTYSLLWLLIIFPCSWPNLKIIDFLTKYISGMTESDKYFGNILDASYIAGLFKQKIYEES